MCAITLTVLPSCKHELPTVEYCTDAASRVKIFDSKRKLGVACEPPATCTDSLGWTIFKRIAAPVKCEGCKMWLAINGKQTYASMVKEEDSSGMKQEESDGTAASPSKKVKVEGDQANKDNEEIEKPSKGDSATEMHRLRASLSRTLGTTGQRRRRFYE